MIVRVGLDVVEVARIEEAIARPRFLERILTPREREECRTILRIAGRWAAKEAIAKAVDIKLKWHDVEISNDAVGAPVAVINHPIFRDGSHRIHLSLSHERGIAAAVAILEQI